MNHNWLEQIIVEWISQLSYFCKKAIEKWYNNIETENLFLTDVLSVNINTKYHCLQYLKNEMYEKLILRIQGRKILNLL